MTDKELEQKIDKKLHEVLVGLTQGLSVGNEAALRNMRGERPQGVLLKIQELRDVLSHCDHELAALEGLLAWDDSPKAEPPA